jgi:hypothetical protein
MKRTQHPPQHNYIAKIHAMWRTGALPREIGLHMLDVAHDDWCAMFEGKRCDCDPDISLKYSLTGGTN